MALSDTERGRARNITKSRKPGQTSVYSDRQKMEAVTTYLMLGSIPLVAATLQISEGTLYHWKQSDWWNDLVREIKKEENLVLSTKIKKIVDKSWDLINDRMENGDYIYDQKTGEMRRKPVNMRDISKVAIDSALLREKLNMNENFTVAADQIEDKLNKLAKAFQDLASGVKPQEVLEAEDIEYTERSDEDALPEERETGLQDGVPEISLHTNPTEEPQ